ncbi:MAG: SDR family oxidoreductase [Clostridium sp.]|uniref:SDR family NAD(P)-dependent oxidoreductase n=1 Tax=Clostridium sp. TaxID=1506 RepID=UPI003070AA3E
MEKRYYAGRFEDKVMIITGAATGIGRATAIRASKEGAKLVLVDIKKEESEKTLQTIIDNGGDAIFLNLDLSKEESAEEMVKATIDKYGKLDIAINNAGVMGEPSAAHLLTKEKMDFTMANNFYSVFYCCKHEINEFIKGNISGVIVNNASIAGLTGLPGNPAYVASKHAVNGLTKNLALDYAKFGIRVNSVNPAGTDTPMVDEAMAFVKAKMADAIAKGIDPSKAQSMAGQKTKSILKGASNVDATAEEQAASILFLVSDDSTHMTGATLQTDGGWTSF